MKSFESTILKLAAAHEETCKLMKMLEETCNKLEKLVSKAEDKQNPVSEKTGKGMMFLQDYPVAENVIDQALKLAHEDDEATFFKKVIDAIESDDNVKPSRLIADYRQATPVERRVIDAIFVDLTGWSLSTLLTNYVESNREEEETEPESSGAAMYIKTKEQLCRKVTDDYYSHETEINGLFFDFPVEMPKGEILEAYAELMDHINGDEVIYPTSPSLSEVYKGNCKDFLEGFNGAEGYHRYCWGDREEELDFVW